MRAVVMLAKQASSGLGPILLDCGLEALPVNCRNDGVDSIIGLLRD
jgi:hypothetical protein